MKGITIKNKKKLHFARHGESYSNIGKEMIDSPLTDNGILQAKKLNGHYDCVIVSPLRRARETLHYSSITYDVIFINGNFRERIFGSTDRMLLEHRTSETDDEFNTRVKNFHAELESLCGQYENILLIGHSYFFNYHYRNGCFPSAPYAELIELL